MPRLVLPSVNNRQPQYAAAVSPAFKPSKDALIFNAVNYVDAVSGKRPDATTLQTTSTQYGVAVKNTYADYASSISLTFSNRAVSGNQVTFAVEFYADGADVSWDILATTAVSNCGFRLTRYFSYFQIVKGAVAILPGVSIGAGWYRAIAGNNAATGEHYVYLKNLTTGAISKNTASDSSTPNAGETSWSVSGGSDSSPTSNTTVAYIDNVFKPYSEMAFFLDNPWQIFAPKKRTLYFRLPNGSLRVPFTTAAAATDNIYLDINNNLQLIKSDGTCKAIAAITE